MRPRSDKLDVINALVHDEYFALDRLAHDLASRELRLPVFRGRWTKALVGWRGRGPGDPPGDPFATLVIGGARAFHVNDSADVGWYDIERVDL